MAGYTNRTDKIADPTYGAKADAARRVAAVPTGAQPQPGGGAGAAPGGMAGVAPPPRLDDPSGRAGEPVTAGLDVGAGPGSEELGMDPTELTAATLRALYRRFPDPTLMRLLARIED